MDNRILGLAAQIVSAHLSNNAVRGDQLPNLIRQVHDALVTVDQPQTVPTRGEPAAPIKQSVFADHIVCLECGGDFSTLRRHLRTSHDLTPELYRTKWDLPSSYPVVAPDYVKFRSAMAKKIGLGRHGGATRAAGKTTRRS